MPPPALGRYYERKRSKYRRLCAATPGAQLLVVAVGTDGALHPESRAQLAMLVGSEARAPTLPRRAPKSPGSGRARGACTRGRRRPRRAR